MESSHGMLHRFGPCSVSTCIPGIDVSEVDVIPACQSAPAIAKASRRWLSALPLQLIRVSVGVGQNLHHTRRTGHVTA